jgi:hypothetical protein
VYNFINIEKVSEKYQDNVHHAMQIMRPRY